MSHLTAGHGRNTVGLDVISRIETRSGHVAYYLNATEITELQYLQLLAEASTP